jgi:hypothetical protein
MSLRPLNAVPSMMYGDHARWVREGKLPRGSRCAGGVTRAMMVRGADEPR